MLFVGADLHKKNIIFCVLQKVNGKLRVHSRVRIPCDQVEAIAAFFRSLDKFQIVVEATLNYDWFAALAEKYADRVVLAHPHKLRIIAESTKKTDKIDARVLAQFLAYDMIPEAWRPTPRVREHRTLVRHRCKIQSHITSIKNRIRGELTRRNADRNDLFTKAGKLAVAKLPLSPGERYVLDDLWAQLAVAKTRLKRCDEALALFAARAPQKEQEARAILASFPQVGMVTTEVILAELGDWRRFTSGDAVVAYAGLAPRVRESDGRRKDLSITKAGSRRLRWCLVQLAHRVKRSSARWQREFDRLSKRIGKKKATCAIARRLAIVLHAMLRDGQPHRHVA